MELEIGRATFGAWGRRECLGSFSQAVKLQADEAPLLCGSFLPRPLSCSPSENPHPYCPCFGPGTDLRKCWGYLPPTKMVPEKGGPVILSQCDLQVGVDAPNAQCTLNLHNVVSS